MGMGMIVGAVTGAAALRGALRVLRDVDMALSRGSGGEPDTLDPPLGQSKAPLRIGRVTPCYSFDAGIGTAALPAPAGARRSRTR